MVFGVVDVVDLECVCFVFGDFEDYVFGVVGCVLVVDEFGDLGVLWVPFVDRDCLIERV